MPAIGIGLAWAAYTAGFWGYCLVRGYNITLKQLLSSKWPPNTVAGTQTQPGQAPLPNIAPGFGIDPTKPYGGGYRPPGSK